MEKNIVIIGLVLIVGACTNDTDGKGYLYECRCHGDVINVCWTESDWLTPNVDHTEQEFENRFRVWSDVMEVCRYLCYDKYQESSWVDAYSVLDDHYENQEDLKKAKQERCDLDE